MGLHFLTLYMATGAESPWLCLTGLTSLHCASSLVWGLHSNGKGDWAIEASTRQGSYIETGLHPGTAPSLPVTHSSSSVPACTQTCGPAPGSEATSSEVCRGPPGHLCSCGTYTSIDSV